MRTLPKFPYKGLTIVLSQPSRFDKTELLSGWAGKWFNDECLQPQCNRYQCDIQSVSDKKDVLPGTKAILLLGERAFQEWTGGRYSSNKLQEQRGYPLDTQFGNIPCIASFNPQDCMDIKDYESRLNPLLNQTEEEHESKSDKEDEKSRHGKTQRNNYKFWLRADTRKILGALTGQWQLPQDNSSRYITYPSVKEIEHSLAQRNSVLYLDIETDANQQLLCFSYAFNKNEIYIVPFIRYNYSFAFDLHGCRRILRALSLAMVGNTTVCHNTLFDLFILCWKYRVHVGSMVYDTMLAQHRCFPESEKSLGHCMSMWTYEKFHKDEGVFSHATPEQERSLWTYNGKDVFGMMLIQEAQLEYAKTVPGLTNSIARVNEWVRPYLINTLLGIRYDNTRRGEMITENDRLCMQYLRCIKLLTGGHAVLPSSNKQCVDYFHDRMNFKVVGRSKLTKKPSLDEKNLQKLKLVYPKQAVIDFSLNYRERLKESGMLKFTPWKSPKITTEQPPAGNSPGQIHSV